MEVTSAQIRAARGLLDISQQELADLSKVSLRTIVQIERGSKSASASIVQALVLSLEAAGIELLTVPTKDGRTCGRTERSAYGRRFPSGSE